MGPGKPRRNRSHTPPDRDLRAYRTGPAFDRWRLSVAADAWERRSRDRLNSWDRSFTTGNIPIARPAGVYTLACLGMEGQPNGAFVLAPQVNGERDGGQAKLSSGDNTAHLPFRKRRQYMSTPLLPAIDMEKLNAFIGQFVTDLGASVHTEHGSHGEKLGSKSPGRRSTDLLRN